MQPVRGVLRAIAGSGRLEEGRAGHGAEWAGDGPLAWQRRFGTIPVSPCGSWGPVWS